jgi:hypothetical protein
VAVIVLRKDLALDRKTFVHMEKVRPVRARPGWSKIIFLGENYMTLCRPFMVGSRSRQPTLSICNLSGRVATLVTIACDVTAVHERKRSRSLNGWQNQAFG